MPVFSLDGRWLVNANGGQCSRVPDSIDERKWAEGPKGPTDTHGVGFSRDGRLAAWAGKGFIVLTNPETGRELARLEDPHQDGLTLPEFNSDGTLLFGTTEDSFCVRVWDLRNDCTAGVTKLGLDWDAPPYPAGSSPDPGIAPLEVHIVGWTSIPHGPLPQEPAVSRGIQDWLNPLDADARLGAR